MRSSKKPTGGTRDAEHTTHVVVDGVELTVKQTGDLVMIKRIVGRDRERKIDITGGITVNIRHVVDPPAIVVTRTLKEVAALRTARCTCDYRYGYSDHAEHCQSIYVAKYDGACVDDD